MDLFVYRFILSCLFDWLIGNIRLWGRVGYGNGPVLDLVVRERSLTSLVQLIKTEIFPIFNLFYGVSIRIYNKWNVHFLDFLKKEKGKKNRFNYHG